jgi:hypothetical protein
MNDFEKLIADQWAARQEKLSITNATFDDYVEDIQKHRRGELIIPIPTGVKALDPHFNFCEGQLNLFTGYPQSGKSEILRFLSCNWARLREGNNRVAVFSPESRTPVLIDDTIITMAGQPRGHNNTALFNAAEKIVKDRFVFTEIGDGMPSIDEIMQNVEMLAKDDVGFFIIDPMNWITSSNYTQMMYESLRLVLTELKQFSKKTASVTNYVEHPKTPQPLKDGTYPRANVFMTNGGAMHFNKCDGIVIMHRLKNADPQGRAVHGDNDNVEFEVAKLKDQKYLGRPATIELAYDWRTGVYSELGFNYGRDGF